MRARVAILVAAAWVASAAGLAAQPRGVVPTDFYKEVGVGDVAVSPAGDLVAFTATTVVEKDNKRHSDDDRRLGRVQRCVCEVGAGGSSASRATRLRHDLHLTSLTPVP